MKLYYFKAEDGNVGDDLNAWLWPKVIGEVLDDDNSHLVIGVGTLLNHRIPLAEKYSVLSSGVGYGSAPPLSTGMWEFIALRGPKTQEAVNAKEVGCLLDGAYLMPRYFQPDTKKRYPVAYIPHVDSVKFGQWQEVCKMADIKFIDPRWPVEKFINELNSCEKVLTEAMHGAILADAYDIAWHPVKAYDYINDFKWQDWAQSLSLDITFSIIPPTWKGDIGLNAKSTIVNKIKRLSKSLGYLPQSWTPPPTPQSKKGHLQKVAKQLLNLAATQEFKVSDKSLREKKTDQLVTTINKFVTTNTK
ncbi:succinoglycan biosynthesis protein exov [Aliiglaciecola sp. 2_MG-2023]|uniref:polysaccharide pyruvyl transferase family protein n=1 Tax=unclassified Aliiglaciecola TaxID=2593648 RepID=UPI0026E2FCD3|nr:MULTISPECIES: polysaccharide pyruvyl transferase family protein [unclassified Aliiglaciecola]MDO6709189.1 succinoglycan biosynthesis protein exov [Aliiglaciecola sp. 2_MG-2023]MDO6750337.1 succinoglycan biosynthesis protein exov [Aliiglaciecola sp. 1_MG-2023]